MKKLFSVLAVLFVLGTVDLFAIGIGAQGGYNPGNAGGNGALTLKVDNVPCIFAITASFGNDISVGVTADWWIKNPKISGPWGYYYGPGLSVSVNTAGGGIWVGGRGVLGTNVRLLDNFLELYLQAAWEPGILIGNRLDFNPWNFPINLGFRLWF